MEVVRRGWYLIVFSSPTDLGFLHVSMVPTPIGENCYTMGNTHEKNLKAKFPSVFSGIVKLMNFQLKLHINPRVSPVVQTIQQIPFSP